MTQKLFAEWQKFSMFSEANHIHPRPRKWLQNYVYKINSNRWSRLSVHNVDAVRSRLYAYTMIYVSHSMEISWHGFLHSLYFRESLFHWMWFRDDDERSKRPYIECILLKSLMSLWLQEAIKGIGLSLATECRKHKRPTWDYRNSFDSCPLKHFPFCQMTVPYFERSYILREGSESIARQLSLAGATDPTLFLSIS